MFCLLVNSRLLEASNPKSTRVHLNDCFHPPLPSLSFHTAKHSNLLGTWKIFQLIFLHSLRGFHQYTIAQKTVIFLLGHVSPWLYVFWTMSFFHSNLKNFDSNKLHRQKLKPKTLLILPRPNSFSLLIQIYVNACRMDLQSEKRLICLCSKSSLNAGFHIRIYRKDHLSSACGSLSAPAWNENGLLLLLKLNNVPRFLTLHYCSFTFKFARLNSWIWLFQRKHAFQLNIISNSWKYTSSIDCLHFPPPPPLLSPPSHPSFPPLLFHLLLTHSL